jgi:hypothetical protein
MPRCEFSHFVWTLGFSLLNDSGLRATQAVLKKHVNLVDLVEGNKKEVQIFRTERELSEYTRGTAKFFPKEDAVDGGVLRALRRHILAPRDDNLRLGKRSRRISRK